MKLALDLLLFHHNSASSLPIPNKEITFSITSHLLDSCLLISQILTVKLVSIKLQILLQQLVIISCQQRKEINIRKVIFLVA